MKLSGIGTAVLLILLPGCQASEPSGFSVGNPDDCSGVHVAVNYGMLSSENVRECVEFEEVEAAASDVLAVAGLSVEGTAEYGDQIVCRVNGLPSATEDLDVPGEDPYVETCASMPPAFAYWALWVKNSPEEAWSYATEGVGTLVLKPGMSVGLAFSTGGDTPTPSDP